MNPEDLLRTQACPSATWVFFIDRMGPDTYCVRRGREVSLVDTETLKSLLNQIRLGVVHDVGGDDVAGA
jgi:hypothetical protein